MWVPLKQYFGKYGTKDPKNYFLPENELSIRILSLLTSNIVDCNEFFQRDDLFYNDVLEKIKQLYVITANIILKKELKDKNFDEIFSIPFESKKEKEIIANDFDPEVKDKLASVEELETSYLSRYDSIKLLLNEIEPLKKAEILNSTIKFIYVSLKKMKSKLPYTNEILLLCQCIFFEEASDEKKWLRLKDLFPNILRTRKQRDDFALEVGRMGDTYNRIREKLKSTISKTSALTIWKIESESYPNVYALVRALLVLPYTSVPVERIFSTMKDIVDQKRNRLTVENVEACLLGCQAFKSRNFSITDQMIDNYMSKKKTVTIDRSKTHVETNSSVMPSQGPVVLEEEKKIEVVTEVKQDIKLDSDHDESDEDEICEEALVVRFERSQDNILKRSIRDNNKGNKKYKL